MERWSTENCARDWNLTILSNGICKSVLENEAKNSQGFSFTNGTPNSKKTRPCANLKKNTCLLVNFAILVEHRENRI